MGLDDNNMETPENQISQDENQTDKQIDSNAQTGQTAQTYNHEPQAMPAQPNQQNVYQQPVGQQNAYQQQPNQQSVYQQPNMYQQNQYNQQSQYQGQNQYQAQGYYNSYNKPVQPMQNMQPQSLQSEQSVDKEKSKGVKGFSLAALMLACVAIGCILSLVLIVFVPNTNNSMLATLAKRYGNSETTIINNGEGGDITIKDETTSVAAAVYAKASRSVVGISVVTKSAQFWEAPEAVISEGSGVIYSEDGLVITNHHVVKSAIQDLNIRSNCEVRIYLDTSLKEHYVAELLGFDENTDLALLKIKVTGLTPIEFAEHKDIKVGETAIAIGSPGGLQYMNSISEGIVSGIDRDIETSDSISFSLIQTTAAINPGNSGGALLNSSGQLIGICVIKIASAEYESMGFAINSDTIKTVMNTIQTDGVVRHPKLGVTIRTDYDSTIANKYNYPEGAYIYEVAADSCADKAGIKPNDIIVQFGEKSIKSMGDLKKSLSEHKVGDSVVIKVYRVEDERELEITVILEA